MGHRRYDSPRSFYLALKAKAATLAGRENLRIADVLQTFYYSRLIARVFHDEPHSWLINGGQALLLRYATGARISRDIDVQRNVGDLDEAVAALHRAAALDLDDFLRFIPDRLAPHAAKSDGASQGFLVLTGTHQVAHVRVDIVIDQSSTVLAETHALKPVVDLDLPLTWPRVNLYPVAKHLGDKIGAMFAIHRGIPSSRYRDLADILLLSQRETVDGTAIHKAVREKIARDHARGVEVRLPTAFRAPSPAWVTNYPEAARQVPGLTGCTTWSEAEACASRFLNPLLGAHTPGRWNPDTYTWDAPRDSRRSTTQHPHQLHSYYSPGPDGHGLRP